MFGIIRGVQTIKMALCQIIELNNKNLWYFETDLQYKFFYLCNYKSEAYTAKRVYPVPAWECL